MAVGGGSWWFVCDGPFSRSKVQLRYPPSHYFPPTFCKQMIITNLKMEGNWNALTKRCIEQQRRVAFKFERWKMHFFKFLNWFSFFFLCFSLFYYYRTPQISPYFLLNMAQGSSNSIFDFTVKVFNFVPFQSLFFSFICSADLLDPSFWAIGFLFNYFPLNFGLVGHSLRNIWD